MATIFKYNEQPSGLINGINKDFVLVNQIQDIESLRISGLEYSNFTFTGNTITLADAPIYPVYVDYFYVDGSTPDIASGTTYAELRSSIYAQIGQDDTSVQFKKAVVDGYILEALKTITKLTPDKRRRQMYSFTRGSDSYVVSYAAGTMVCASVSDSVTTPSSAALEGGDIVSFTGKTTTSITGVTGLTITNPETLNIRFGYQLPSNAYNVRQVYVDNIPMAGLDFGRSIPQIDYDSVSIYNNILYLPYDISGEGKIVTVVYEPSPTASYAEDDAIDFYGDYDKIIKSYVKYNLYIDREDVRQEAEKRRYEETLKEYKAEIRKELYPKGGRIMI